MTLPIAALSPSSVNFKPIIDAVQVMADKMVTAFNVALQNGNYTQKADRQRRYLTLEVYLHENEEINSEAEEKITKAFRCAGWERAVVQLITDPTRIKKSKLVLNLSFPLPVIRRSDQEIAREAHDASSW